MLSIFIIFFIGASTCTAQLYDSKVIFHYSSGSNTYDLLQADKIFANPKFDKTRRTVMYSHGFRDNTDTDHIRLLLNAYKKINEVNILLFDWRELANNIVYPTIVMNMAKLGEELAKFIIKGTTQGYVIDNWHIFGHSLGAQLSGIVGKRIKALSKGSLILKRISGLDPALPGFYGIVLGPQPISKSDAVFVDIIHTDAGRFGADVNTGTVDFWPNNGRRPQPGCSFMSDLIGCSHSRAVYFWIESVENRGRSVFTSRSVLSPGTRIRMGIDCPTNTPPGRYDLSTNDKPPFSVNT